MTNKITIDIDTTLAVDDHSIVDPETIRQIALLCEKSPKDVAQKLSNKIKFGHEVCGLYPHVMNYTNIRPTTHKKDAL